MSQLRYSLTFDMAAQMDLAAGINAKVMPALNQAVKVIAKQAAANWAQAVMQAKLWSEEKDAYVKSIKWEMTGDFSAVVSSDYKYAEEIETGRPARDLKRMLDTSLKVRRTDKGKRFLVIPLRHNTPGNAALAPSMPDSVYDLAQQMAPSSVVAMGQRPSGEITHLSPKTGMSPAAFQTPFLSNPKTKQAAMVVARKYAWGDRLTKGALKGAGLDAAAVRRYAGMVRMDTSTPGGGKSSQHMTFRIMMDGQTGKWIVPAQPGLYLVKKVVDDLAPKAQKAFELAAQKAVSG